MKYIFQTFKEVFDASGSVDNTRAVALVFCAFCPSPKLADGNLLVNHQFTWFRKNLLGE
jgi:hypothetical protein